MNPIALLTAQHEEASRLITEVEGAAGAERWRAFQQLARALLLHGQLEEDVFYPEMRLAETEAFLSAAFDEHGQVRKLVAALAKLRPDSREFEATLTELKQAVLLHVQAEEKVLFPSLEAMVPSARMDRIGLAMDQRRHELEQPDALPAFDQPPPQL